MTPALEEVPVDVVVRTRLQDGTSACVHLPSTPGATMYDTIVAVCDELNARYSARLVYHRVGLAAPSVADRRVPSPRNLDGLECSTLSFVSSATSGHSTSLCLSPASSLALSVSYACGVDSPTAAFSRAAQQQRQRQQAAPAPSAPAAAAAATPADVAVVVADDRTTSPAQGPAQGRPTSPVKRALAAVSKFVGRRRGRGGSGGSNSSVAAAAAASPSAEEDEEGAAAAASSAEGGLCVGTASSSDSAVVEVPAEHRTGVAFATGHALESLPYVQWCLKVGVPLQFEAVETRAPSLLQRRARANTAMAASSAEAQKAAATAAAAAAKKADAPERRRRRKSLVGRVRSLLDS